MIFSINAPKASVLIFTAVLGVEVNVFCVASHQTYGALRGYCVMIAINLLLIIYYVLLLERGSAVVVT